MSDAPRSMVKVRYAAPPQAGPGAVEAVAYLRNLKQNGVVVSIKAGESPKMVRDLGVGEVPPPSSEVMVGSGKWKPYTNPSDLVEDKA